MSRVLTLASDKQYILKRICPGGLRGSFSLCRSGCTIPELKMKLRHQMFVFVLCVVIPSHHNPVSYVLVVCIRPYLFVVLPVWSISLSP